MTRSTERPGLFEDQGVQIFLIILLVLLILQVGQLLNTTRSINTKLAQNPDVSKSRSAMANPTQSAIVYPQKFLPGTVDNWVSNERIVKNISAQQIWDLLIDISKWPSYYKNVSQISQPSTGPILAEGSMFKFSTFGFPVLECPVEECTPPSNGKPGRLAWSAKLDGNEDEKVEVYHAWLVEDLEGGRVRILTQESQIGKPAAQLEGKKPNVMLLGHQDWCDGLVEAAMGRKVTKETETNLGVAGLLAY